MYIGPIIPYVNIYLIVKVLLNNLIKNVNSFEIKLLYFYVTSKIYKTRQNVIN